MTNARPRYRIPWARPFFGGREDRYVLDALKSTWISDGKYLQRLERRFCAYHDAPYGLAVSSGTAALFLALRGLGIGHGDEVIIPGFSFVAPANMVCEAGARPVYADIDPATWCLDPSSVEKKITRRTRAILPVHTYGNVCEMDALRSLARSRGLRLIEDAAEAAFSRYRGRLAGTFSDAGCFSFQAAKTMTTGEGGFILARSRSLYETMLKLRNHGMSGRRRYWHDVKGYNFRLTNVQAALGCAQLERIGQALNQRKAVRRWYERHLASVPGIVPQAFRPGVDPAVWTYAVKVQPPFFKGGRDFVMKALGQAGIETRPGFFPFGAMPVYDAPRLPVSDDVARNVACLPFYPGLSEHQVVYICEQIKKLRA